MCNGSSMPLRWICSDFPAARLPIDYNIYECSCVRNRFTHSTQLNHSMIFRVPDDWYVLLVCARIIFRAGLRDPIFRRCLRVGCVGRLALFRGVTGRCVVCGVGSSDTRLWRVLFSVWLIFRWARGCTARWVAWCMVYMLTMVNLIVIVG